jgi:hypothetical protein
MVNFVTSTEIFDDEETKTLLDIRYDSCDVGNFVCNFVEYNEDMQ